MARLFLTFSRRSRPFLGRLSVSIRVENLTLDSHHVYISPPLTSLTAHAPDCFIASFTLHRLVSILACAYHSNMSSPSRRLSGAPDTNTGPSRSVLQQLLEEINGPDNPTAPRHTRNFQGTPKPIRSTSAWVAGSSIAQDARAKLRAADEARQRKLSVNSTDGTPVDQAPPSLRRHSTQTGIYFMAPGTSIWKPPHNSSPTFHGVDFADRATSPTTRTNSPTTGSRGNVSRRFSGGANF